MVYEYKTKGLFPVKAQDAGEEIERIYKKYGEVQPETVVEESKDRTAVLHSCFEWNDARAAMQYRTQQARTLIGNITVTVEQTDEPVTVRAYAHVCNAYHPMSVIISDVEKMDELMKNAMRELQAFRRKYNTLEQLSGIFTEIEKLEAV